MPKIYNNKNVYEAAIERYEFILSEFPNVYFSISGGKDSSAMVQIGAQVARELGRKFDVLYIDLEAQYQATINHIEELRINFKDVVNQFYWVCLPLSLRNAVSVLQPKWICWDKKVEEKWVRGMPNNEDVVNEYNCPWDWFYRGMEFEEFIILFAKWYSEKGLTACGVGIRANESLHRFATITNDKKEMYKGKAWTTRIKPLNVYNFYPLYDWRTEDIWTAVAKLDLLFNQVYELMYKNGVSIYEQRLCQPFGDDQRNGLNQYRALEFDTWGRLLNRVAGVNFGNIYCKTALLGNLTTEKPEHMTWQQYAVFLLETIGLYAPELRDHYYKKIKTFIEWYEEQGISFKDFPEEADLNLEQKKKVPSWRRIARAIERNDFWMKRLSFGQTKSDVKEYFELKKKYKNLAKKDETDDKHLRRLCDEEDSVPST